MHACVHACMYRAPLHCKGPQLQSGSPDHLSNVKEDQNRFPKS